MKESKLFKKLNNESADIALVDKVAEKMREKLNKKRKEGYGGWHTSHVSNAELKARLIAHIDKGDMIDVMNFAAMIYMRKEIYDE